MLSVGKKLSIETVKGEQIEEKLHSKVFDLTNDHVFIDYPVNQQTGRTHYFIENTKVRVSFVSDHEVVFQFYSEVKRRKWQGMAVLELDYPQKDELMKIQRREYVRVNTNLDIALYPLDEEREPLISYTLDISGGGIAVKAHEIKFNEGEELDLMIVLPLEANQYIYLNAIGEVIRYSQMDGSSWKLSIKFNSIDDEKREAIIKFCFDQQLQRRRKLKS
ncbi:flagellar brake protein [Alkalibacillus almallahensis]|uniref:flagellar brake protein n=1 Tax=Alkalibacillus almallahensis TaxID=1379154 RepID=UPI001422BCA5|nr:flagellar brake domain-containing protein [Alkalibacillus almallahensis]NIK12319.1 c-di-GMP-binding flagellar brake protein YcgR [Alkalibacillus almallahensis]